MLAVVLSLTAGCAGVPSLQVRVVLGKIDKQLQGQAPQGSKDPQLCARRATYRVSAGQVGIGEHCEGHLHLGIPT